MLSPKNYVCSSIRAVSEKMVFSHFEALSFCKPSPFALKLGGKVPRCTTVAGFISKSLKTVTLLVKKLRRIFM